MRYSFSYTGKCIVLLLSGFVFFQHLLIAQTDAENIKKQFEDYSQNNPQEKIFIHTDKSFYVPGEVIWFKAYVVDARFNVPVDLSKVAYIEILDKNNTPVLQTKIELTKGSGDGSFLLPVSITSGNFLLRAYTRWMRNFDADLYFQKSITIVNTLKNLLPEPAIPLSYDMQFFPEGGNLVQGISSKVAFKFTDQHGKGIDCDGLIRNQTNDTVASFKTFRNGAGNFSFTPKAGDTYKAFINVRKDSTVVASFPAVYESGYVMSVEDEGNQLKVTVTIGNKGNEQFVYLLSHTRRKINTAEQKTVSGNKTSFSIDKSALPAGVTTFTVFNGLKQPVCERLYFKRPEPQQLAVKTDNAVYALRSKVALDIATAAALSINELTDISVAVYKTDSLQSTDNIDIATYFWLTSELKGNLESPSSYFMQRSAEADTELDNVMLTNGWRRFKWEDVLSNKKPSFEFIPEYEGHIIAGKITNKQTGLPEANVMGYLSAPARKYQFAGALSNNKGEILFNTKDFKGSDQIIVQTEKKNYNIDILNPYSENYPKSTLAPIVIPVSIQRQLLYHSINSQVQTTYINDSLNKFYYPFTDTTHFYGPPYNSYKLDDYVRFTTMEEVLREYVTEVSPRRQNKKMHLYMLKNSHEFYNQDPLVLVDGVPFFDMDTVMAIDPLKIQKIEVLGRKFHAGVITTSGIMSLSTYKGDLDGVRLDPNAVVMEYEGLQLKREFYAPMYETAAQKNNRTPDFRNLLYWSPDVKTNQQGKQHVSFYTSDLEGKYFISIQGVSTTGKIFYTTTAFEVKK